MQNTRAQLSAAPVAAAPAQSAAAPQARPAPARQLQRRAGNQAVQSLACAAGIQARPAVSVPGDEDEREAERAAARVMRSASAPAVQRQAAPGGDCEPCKRKRLGLLRKAGGGPTGAVLPESIPAVVGQALRSPAQPLDAATRASMEAGFGHDFGDVRVHTGDAAEESASAINALAYTRGADIVFASGQYAPGTSSGRALLAHELAHVVQQGAGAARAAVQRQDAGAPAPAAAQPAAAAAAPPGGPPAPAAANAQVEFEGQRLSTNPSELRAILWPVFLQDGAAGLQRYLGRYRDGIEADRRQIESMRGDISRNEQLARDLQQYGSGDVSGTPMTPDMIATVEQQIQDIQRRIDDKERIRPVLDTAAQQVRDDPRLTVVDIQAIARLQGSNQLFGDVRSYREAQNTLQLARAVRGSSRDPAMAAESIAFLEQRVDEARARVDRGLAAQHFANLDEFLHATSQFESIFQRYAVQTAFAMLSENEQLVRAEFDRYGIQPGNADVGAMYRDLQQFRDKINRARELERQFRQQNLAAGPAIERRGIPLRAQGIDENLSREAGVLRGQAREELDRLGGTYPVLLDRTIDTDSLARAGVGELQTIVHGTAQDRLNDIASARRHLTDDPENVWDAEGALNRAKQALNVAPGSVYAGIIQDKLDRVAHRRLFRDLFLAAIALGITIATAGAAAPVVAAGAVGSAAISGVTFYLHLQEYQTRAAFAGSSFDRARALSAEQPDLFSLALDLVGFGLDLGAAASALRELGPLVRAARTAEAEAQAAGKTVRELEELRTAGNAVEGAPGLGDRLVEQVRSARADEQFLAHTAEQGTHAKPLANADAAHELSIAERSPTRRFINEGEYVEEITLQNGHTWKRTRDGRWCRFSDPMCFLTGGGPPGAAVHDAAPATAATGAAWRSPVADANAARYEQMVARRGSAAQELGSAAPANWTGRLEAEFRGYPFRPEELPDGYHWTLEPSTGRPRLDRDTVTLPNGAERPRMEYDPAARAFKEVEDNVVRARFAGPETTVPIPADQRARFDSILQQREAARTERDLLETAGESRELSQARYSVNEASRQLGEQAAEAYVRGRFPAAQRVYPPPGAQSVSRAGDFDQVWRVPGGRPDGGDLFLVVEAKGGSSGLGTRGVAGGGRAEQGTRAYFGEIATSMAGQQGTARQTGQSLLAARNQEGAVQYILVQAPIGTEAGRSVLRDIRVRQFDIRP